MGRGEELELLASAARTDTTTSKEFTVPVNKTGLFVYLELTVGSTLLIDFDLEVELPGPAAWLPISIDAPSTAGITGTSTTTRFYAPILQADADHDVQRVVIDGNLRVVVRHGNGTSATYQVWAQFV